MLALTAIGVPAQSPPVDWRSRREVGRDVLLEFELEDRSQHRRSGGGTGYLLTGTIRDRVFAREEGDAIGVRLVTRTNGTITTTEIFFFRTSEEGVTEDDTPLTALLLPQYRHELPFSDPLGALVGEFVPGLDREREIEILDPEFRSIWPGPIRARETVVSVLDRWSQIVVTRSWKASDENGLLDPEGKRALLALEDHCTLGETTGILAERRLSVSFLSPPSSEMVQHRTWTIREVASGWDEPLFPPDMEEGLLLRQAYRLVRARPRDALTMLSDWSPSSMRGGGMPDVAAQIWLLAKEYQARLDQLLRAELDQLGQAAWSALDLSTDEASQAVWDGRLTAVFSHAGLEAQRHREVVLRKWANEGRSKPTLQALEQLHEAGSRDTGHELRDRTLSAARQQEAAKWFEARMAELER